MARAQNALLGHESFPNGYALDKDGLPFATDQFPVIPCYRKGMSIKWP